MKFAKELEEELVPEWRAKYLDYKAGKKKLKAVTRAIQRASRSPREPSLRPATPTRDHGRSSMITESSKKLEPNSTLPPSTPVKSGPRSTPRTRSEHNQASRTPGSRFSGHAGGYGSIVASPRQPTVSSDVASLQLPDPALDPGEGCPSLTAATHDTDTHDYAHDHPKSPSPTVSPRNTVETLPTSDLGNRYPDRRPSFAASKGSQRGHNKEEASSAPASKRKSPLVKRVFSYTGDSSQKRSETVGTEPEDRQDEFFEFLDSELSKIETFYRSKEEEATQRLKTLRQQLHIMRDQRIHDVLAAKKKGQRPGHDVEDTPKTGGFAAISAFRLKDTLPGWTRFGKNSEALVQMGNPDLQARNRESVATRRDFTRRPDNSQNPEVSYRSAKRKLKHALQEFYRGLELLKAYAYLNGTAFRKINKKYDKVVNARPTMRYMSEKINKAWFVQSDALDNLMTVAEDLYARYFERGNRKVAISKLRRTSKKSEDYHANTFRSGLLLMAGTLFAIQSLVYASQHLDHSDSVVKTRTAYLLQIYGGYFLVVFHYLLYCIVCMVWSKTKINHVFVFEFDTRNALDWCQLIELPSGFFFLLGLFMWLNFLSLNDMYIYWPVVLVGLTMVVLFLPAPVLYHHSRKWWAYSNWRLLLAGFYPVEFRDFFLGDMYCSQTYAMGNIALFFCLYSKHWNNSPQCNSNHSRLLGFFTCLPAVWRALQCLRRYADTKNIFPHLLNFGKYMFTVLYYMTLSMYRIKRTTRFEAPFITFALLNAVYCSVWDLAMDWSLGNPYAKHPLLRDVLAFRKAWIYYTAMVIDVLIRFNWIFYAIFTHDIQHSAVLSFVVSFSEVCRRGVWTVFRVENEHCTNVVLFRASRDIPLPYEISTPATEPGRPTEAVQIQEQTYTPFLVPTDAEAGAPSTPGTPARPRGQLSRVGTIVASAHAQDFQRRKRPDEAPVGSVSHAPGQSPDDSSDDGVDREVDDSSDLRQDTDDDVPEGYPSHIRISEESNHISR